MLEYRVTQGEVSEALSIMGEAAQWLIRKGSPMWLPDDLIRERIQNPPEAFWVLRDGHIGVATLLLSFEDRFFWPEIPPGSSGFIHKLAVRRAYAGRGMAEVLIAHCVEVCRARNVHALRLDCDAHRQKLCDLYEKCGFTLRETRSYRTKRLGDIEVALYELLF